MSDYERRVRALEAEGLTRSDAQGVVDAAGDVAALMLPFVREACADVACEECARSNGPRYRGPCTHGDMPHGDETDLSDAELAEREADERGWGEDCDTPMCERMFHIGWDNGSEDVQQGDHFALANQDDPQLVAWIGNAKIGDQYHGGGGAAPSFTITREGDAT